LFPPGLWAGVFRLSPIAVDSKRSRGPVSGQATGKGKKRLKRKKIKTLHGEHREKRRAQRREESTEERKKKGKN
jgi:hypothetical protein